MKRIIKQKRKTQKGGSGAFSRHIKSRKAIKGRDSSRAKKNDGLYVPYNPSSSQSGSYEQDIQYENIYNTTNRPSSSPIQKENLYKFMTPRNLEVPQFKNLSIYNTINSPSSSLSGNNNVFLDRNRHSSSLGIYREPYLPPNQYNHLPPSKNPNLHQHRLYNKLTNRDKAPTNRNNQYNHLLPSNNAKLRTNKKKPSYYTPYKPQFNAHVYESISNLEHNA
jgi:hypothetical protein